MSLPLRNRGRLKSCFDFYARPSIYCWRRSDLTLNPNEQTNQRSLSTDRWINRWSTIVSFEWYKKVFKLYDDAVNDYNLPWNGYLLCFLVFVFNSFRFVWQWRCCCCRLGVADIYNVWRCSLGSITLPSPPGLIGFLAVRHHVNINVLMSSRQSHVTISSDCLCLMGPTVSRYDTKSTMRPAKQHSYEGGCTIFQKLQWLPLVDYNFYICWKVILPEKNEGTSG